MYFAWPACLSVYLSLHDENKLLDASRADFNSNDDITLQNNRVMHKHLPDSELLSLNNVKFFPAI